MSLIYIRRIFSFDIRTRFLSRVNAACIVIECLLLNFANKLSVWGSGDRELCVVQGGIG